MASTHETIGFGLDVRAVQDVCVLVGRIISVSTEADAATVHLDGVGAVADVPIFYHCEARDTVEGGRVAFHDDDDVLVLAYDARNPHTVTEYEIVGFPDEPRPCRREIALIVAMAAYGDGTYRAITLAWDLAKNIPYWPPGHEMEEDGWWAWDTSLSTAFPVVDAITGWFSATWANISTYLGGHVWEYLKDFECVSTSLYDAAALTAGEPADLDSPTHAFASGTALPTHDPGVVGGKSVGLVDGAVVAPFALGPWTPLRIDSEELGFSGVYVDVPVFHPEDLVSQPWRRPFGNMPEPNEQEGWTGSETCYLPDGYEMTLDPALYYCVPARDQYTIHGAVSPHGLIAIHIGESHHDTGPNLPGSGVTRCTEWGISAVSYYGETVAGVDPAALAPGELSFRLWARPDIVAIKHIGIYDLSKPLNP